MNWLCDMRIHTGVQSVLHIFHKGICCHGYDRNGERFGMLGVPDCLDRFMTSIKIALYLPTGGETNISSAFCPSSATSHSAPSDLSNSTAISALRSLSSANRLYKSQKYPILHIRFFIDQIIVPSIQVYHHRIGMSFFKLL